MKKEIETFIIGLIEKKYSLPDACDLETFDYLESGHVDSIRLMSFVLEIEEKYDVEIDDGDFERDQFKTIGGLAALVVEKL